MQSKYLLLRMEAPLQSWGVSSKYDYRSTEKFPTKSGVVGLLGAAGGVQRGDVKRIAELASFKMMAVSCRNGGQLQDYHTVQSIQAVTERCYLMDSDFVVILEGDGKLVDDCVLALKNPVYAPYLGRKCCRPSAPILMGHYDTWPEVLACLKEKGLTNSPMNRDATTDEETDQIVQDVPIDFSLRTFTSRRVVFESTKSLF